MQNVIQTQVIQNVGVPNVKGSFENGFIYSPEVYPRIRQHLNCPVSIRELRKIYSEEQTYLDKLDIPLKVQYKEGFIGVQGFLALPQQLYKLFD